jgi:5-methylcytosine-specific restriction endonuclease McrA
MTRGGTPDPTRPWRGWYALTRWRKRRRHQLYLEPYCRLCQQRGVLRAAEIVDHVKHHGGRWNDFWLGDLQSLCKDCHDSAKKRIEQKGYDPYWVGDDGWPVDPNHPANR